MVGNTLSHYRIQDEIGRGGMGIVYLAEDMKLDRQVAIKVLPSSALASEEDRARFYREAKAAAALNHPNIAQIYQIDEAIPSDAPHGTQPSPFIAMEYIDGEPLDVLIKRGPLKLEEAVRLATQIASAVGEAHEKGIVHRDVKASNVMLTSKGDAKVLDFGLALTAASTKLTRMGSTLGTVAYMSPEQARGEEVDRRTDLWSMGVILYEMISGKSPFPGDYEQAVVYEILNQDPEPLTAIRTGVPMGVEWIVFKCLAKQAEARYQNAGDLLVDLKNVDLSKGGMSRVSTIAVANSIGAGNSGSGGPMENPQYEPTFAGSLKKTWPVALIAIASTLALGYLLLSTATDQTLHQQAYKLPLLLDGIVDYRAPTESPASDYIAFLGTDTLGRQGLFLLDLRTSEINRINGTDDAWMFRFSPNGSQLAYADGTGIYTVATVSGTPTRATETGFNPIWETDESILFQEFSSSNLFRIDLVDRTVSDPLLPDAPLEGGYLLRISHLIAERDLALGHRTNVNQADPALGVIDLKSENVHALDDGIFNPVYLPQGYLLYSERSTPGIVALRPFDLRTRSFSGPSTVLFDEMDPDVYSVSPNGNLLYNPEPPGNEPPKLFFVDVATGDIRSVDGPASDPRWPGRPAYSPKGVSIALHVQDVDNSFAIYEYDIELDTWAQLTFEANRRDPEWSVDGTALYFDGLSSGSPGIYRMSIREDDEEKRIIEGEAGNPSPSPNGRWLAYSDGSSINLYDLESGELSVLDSTYAPNYHPDFSPDGQYVAYEKNREGRWQIAVRSVEGSSPHLFGTGSARRPKWAPDGNSIYFVDEGRALYRQAVMTEPFFRPVGSPERIIYAKSDLAGTFFDISPNGQTLVIAASYVDKQPISTGGDYSTVVWWQNWAQSLSRD